MKDKEKQKTIPLIIRPEERKNRHNDRIVSPAPTLGTFRSEDKDDYEYEFSVLSTRTSKHVGL